MVDTRKKRETIFQACFVEISIIIAHSSFFIIFLDNYHISKPFWIVNLMDKVDVQPTTYWFKANLWGFWLTALCSMLMLSWCCVTSISISGISLGDNANTYKFKCKKLISSFLFSQVHVDHTLTMWSNYLGFKGISSQVSSATRCEFTNNGSCYFLWQNNWCEITLSWFLRVALYLPHSWVGQELHSHIIGWHNRPYAVEGRLLDDGIISWLNINHKKISIHHLWTTVRSQGHIQICDPYCGVWVLCKLSKGGGNGLQIFSW